MSKAPLRVLEFSVDDSLIEVRADRLSGDEEVYLNDTLVSQISNSGSNRSIHEFELPGRGVIELRIQNNIMSANVAYELVANGLTITSGQGNQELGAESAESEPVAPKSPTPWLSFAGLGLKLFKSGGIIKAALFGASYASFALLTDWRLGALLIAILVFHEYGHLRAMRSFGMKTKGMYLIPFVGGVAVGEKATTYWQETYISMQGPVFGLYMTLLAWAGYVITDWNLLGALASFSALINVFNLLPIYPLDGGHVVKACAMSLSKGNSWVFLVLFAAFGVAGSIWSGLYLLAFFSVIGALDLLSGQRAMRDQDVVRMSGYGVAVSLAWYVGTICVFVFVMYWLYQADVPGANIPMLILQDR